MKISALCPVLSCFVIGAQIVLASTGKRIVCVYDGDETKFVTPYNYRPKDIPMELCTDIVFQSAQIDDNTWKVVAPPRWANNVDIMRQFTAKGSAASPNFIVSVGRFFDGQLLQRVARYGFRRLTFIASALRLIRDYGFNGLDLNFETAQPWSDNFEDYVKLVEELVEKKPADLLLTGTLQLKWIADIKTGKSGVKNWRWNLDRLSQLFDWINVRAYFPSGYHHHVDVPSPLYRRDFDNSYREFYNLHDGLDLMVQLGAPRLKLMVGISFQGTTYTLRRRNETSLNAPTSTEYSYTKWGAPGPVTKNSGHLYYYEICRMLTTNKWNKRFDHQGMCPYAFLDDQWIGYEDEESIWNKMEFVKNFGYGGAYVWTINEDDFVGICGPKNPLLRAVHSALQDKHSGPEVGSEEELLHKRYEALGINICSAKCPCSQGTKASDGGKRIVCRYAFHDGTYEPKDIPVELCTDLIFESAKIDNKTWEVVEPQISGSYILFNHLGQFTGQASRSSAQPRFFMSVGDYDNRHLWQPISMDESKRLTFISSALNLIRENGFNGLNLYWEDPLPEDRDNYVKLVEELVEKKPAHLLLTITLDVPEIIKAYERNISSAFNIRRLSELVDWINMNQYLPSSRDYVDVESPLFRRQVDFKSGMQLYNLHDSLEIIEKLGAPRHKMMVYISFLTSTFTLRRSSDTSLRALTSRWYPVGNPGTITKLGGILYHYEVCRMLATGKWNERFDDEGISPYAFLDDQWISYENEKSIRIKMEYIKNRGYGGVNVRYINMDDFTGVCGSRNPLLHAVHSALQEDKEPEVDPRKEILLKRFEALGIPVNRGECP